LKIFYFVYGSFWVLFLVVECSHCSFRAVAACSSFSSTAAMLPRHGLQWQLNNTVFLCLVRRIPLIVAVLAVVGHAQSVGGTDANVLGGLNFDEFGSQNFLPKDTHQGYASEIGGKGAPEAFCPSSIPASEELCNWSALPNCHLATAAQAFPFNFKSNPDSFLPL
jgi:hypothetical protein